MLLSVHLLNALGALGLPEVASQALYHVMTVGATGLCLMRALRVAHERSPWLVFTAGMTLWTVADLSFLPRSGCSRR